MFAQCWKRRGRDRGSAPHDEHEQADIRRSFRARHRVCPGALYAAAEADAKLEAATLEFLLAALRLPSVSGKERELTHFVADWGRQHGFHVDLWQADESLLGLPHEKFGRHLPLAGRPTLVVELPGDPALPSLLFNAHADVVPVDPTGWSCDPWGGTWIDGRVVGRGACDDKGPLTTALWAMMKLARQPQRRGSIRLELVPGEEDCVGLGTFTSLMRGWTADAVVVLSRPKGFRVPRCAAAAASRLN